MLCMLYIYVHMCFNCIELFYKRTCGQNTIEKINFLSMQSFEQHQVHVG